jgi:hypothetical protein
MRVDALPLFKLADASLPLPFPNLKIPLATRRSESSGRAPVPASSEVIHMPNRDVKVTSVV